MTCRSHFLCLTTLAGAALLLAACSTPMHRGGPMAAAKLEATRGNTATGMVMFHAMGDHAMLHAKIEGLKPGQEHGFHIHEKGDCGGGDGMAPAAISTPRASPTAPMAAPSGTLATCRRSRPMRRAAPKSRRASTASPSAAAAPTSSARA